MGTLFRSLRSLKTRNFRWMGMFRKGPQTKSVSNLRFAWKAQSIYLRKRKSDTRELTVFLPTSY